MTNIEFGPAMDRYRQELAAAANAKLVVAEEIAAKPMRIVTKSDAAEAVIRGYGVELVDLLAERGFSITDRILSEAEKRLRHPEKSKTPEKLLIDQIGHFTRVGGYTVRGENFEGQPRLDYYSYIWMDLSSGLIEAQQKDLVRWAIDDKIDDPSEQLSAKKYRERFIAIGACLLDRRPFDIMGSGARAV